MGRRRNLNHEFNLPEPQDGFKAVDYVIVGVSSAIIVAVFVISFGIWIVVAHG